MTSPFNHQHIDAQITDVFIGTTRYSLLDRANPDLALAPVVENFGKYIKIVVLEEDNETRNRLSLGCVIPTNSRAVPSQITE